MEELTAEGATFPVKVLMPYNPSSTNWDKECQVVEQQLEGLLGSDYIDVIVEAGAVYGLPVGSPPRRKIRSDEVQLGRGLR